MPFAFTIILRCETPIPIIFDVSYNDQKGNSIMNNSRILRKTFYAQVFAFFISSLTQTIGSMVDGVIIGQCLGTDSIAAFGIINPLLTVFSVFGAVVATGSRAVFTKLIGAGKKKEAQSVFSLSCVLSVGLASVLMALNLLFSTPIARLLGASGNAAELLPKASGYLVGVAIGLPAMNAVKTLSGYMAIDNDRSLPIIASVVLTAVDIALDLFVAFVLHGDTFEMGLATSLSYYAAALVLLTHFLKKKIFLRLSFRNLCWKDTGTIIAKGLPAGVCRASNTLRSSFMNILLATIASTAAIAAYSVHRQADSFLNPITMGMAEAVAIIAGVLMGEENRAQMKRLLLTSLQATLIITVSISVLVYILAPQFCLLFINNSFEALGLSVVSVRCYAIGMPFYCLNVIYQCYLQGIEKSKLSLVAGFLLEAGFLMLSAFVMSFFLGANAVWYALPVTQLLMFFFYRIVISVESRRLKIQHESFWDRVLLMPSTFDVPDEDQMEKSITSQEEVVALSEAVWDFCDAHGCNEKTKYLISLSIEELAGNIIQHGFSKDKKRHSIDVRVVKNGDDYIVRIRDDCLIFDPVEQLELYSDENPTHHIGLRMISAMAKDLQYTCIFKLNNLVIRV